MHIGFQRPKSDTWNLPSNAPANRVPNKMFVPKNICRDFTISWQKSGKTVRHVGLFGARPITCKTGLPSGAQAPTVQFIACACAQASARERSVRVWPEWPGTPVHAVGLPWNWKTGDKLAHRKPIVWLNDFATSGLQDRKQTKHLYMYI